MNSVDIDIGGTFTDCSVQFEGRRTEVKSLTTGFDLSVGFLTALEEAAAKLEFGLEELMQGTNVIRYSTTLAMNKLLERRGPKIGLITTEGFEDLILIGRGAQWDDGLSRPESRNLALVAKPEPLVPRERIVGLKERVDNQGRVLRPLNEDHARENCISGNFGSQFTSQPASETQYTGLGRGISRTADGVFTPCPVFPKTNCY